MFLLWIFDSCVSCVLLDVDSALVGVFWILDFDVYVLPFGFVGCLCFAGNESFIYSTSVIGSNGAL